MHTAHSMTTRSPGVRLLVEPGVLRVAGIARGFRIAERDLRLFGLCAGCGGR